MNFITVFKFAALSLLLGRVWLYLVWSAPLRTLLWSETYLEGFITGVLGLNWNDYVTDPKVDIAINLVIQGFGLFFLITFVATLFFKPSFTKGAKILLWAGGLMFFLILLRFAEKFFYIGMLIEHAIQIGAPVVFYLLIKNPEVGKKFILFVKVLIAFTFIGHALFAIGFHPVPGNFIDMIISILGVSEDNAVRLLLVAGTIDIVASVLLFIKGTEKYALFFMIFWGTATALARIFANFNIDLAYASGMQWIPETIYRFPHALIPLGLYLLLRDRAKDKSLEAQGT